MIDEKTRPPEAPLHFHDADGKPRFITDPIVERLMQAVLNLTWEVWAQKDQLSALMALLDENGAAATQSIVARMSEPSVAASRDSELQKYLERVLLPLRQAPAEKKAG